VLEKVDFDHLFDLSFVLSVVACVAVLVVEVFGIPSRSLRCVQHAQETLSVYLSIPVESLGDSDLAHTPGVRLIAHQDVTLLD